MLLSSEINSHIQPLKYSDVSFGQERIWRHQILNNLSSIYNIPLSYKLQGPLDVDLFECCIKKVVQRHETLRTAITKMDDQPMQAIYPSISFCLRVVKLEDLPAAEKEAKVRELSAKEAKEPFDLKQAPLWRAKILHLTPNEHIFLFNIHHIVSDRWSVHLFMEEVVTFYEAGLQGKDDLVLPVPKQYRDFALEQKQWLGKKQESQLSYWQEQLSGEVLPLLLPIDKQRTPLVGYEGERQEFVVAEDVTQRLKQLTENNELTLYITLLGVFFTWLYQYTRQEDMVVCSPVAGRHRFQTKDSLGYFVNILPMAINLGNEPTFLEVLSRIKTFVGGTYKNLDIPFQTIAQLPNLVRTPLTRGFFALQPRAKRLNFSQIDVSYQDLPTGTANFEIALFLEEKEGVLVGLIDYKTELFDAATISEMIDNFQSLLKNLLANPEQHLYSLPRLKKELKELELPLSNIREKYIAPQKEKEKIIANIWQEILKVEKVGVNQNFFELGGQSMAVAQVIGKINEIFKKNLLIIDIFRYPTISTLADYLSKEKPVDGSGFEHLQDKVQRRQEMFKRQKQIRHQRRSLNGGE